MSFSELSKRRTEDYRGRTSHERWREEVRAVTKPLFDAVMQRLPPEQRKNPYRYPGPHGSAVPWWLDALSISLQAEERSLAFRRWLVLGPDGAPDAQRDRLFWGLIVWGAEDPPARDYASAVMERFGCPIQTVGRLCMARLGEAPLAEAQNVTELAERIAADFRALADRARDSHDLLGLSRALTMLNGSRRAKVVPPRADRFAEPLMRVFAEAFSAAPDALVASSGAWDALIAAATPVRFLAADELREELAAVRASPPGALVEWATAPRLLSLREFARSPERAVPWNSRLAAGLSDLGLRALGGEYPPGNPAALRECRQEIDQLLAELPEPLESLFPKGPHRLAWLLHVAGRNRSRKASTHGTAPAPDPDDANYSPDLISEPDDAPLPARSSSDLVIRLGQAGILLAPGEAQGVSRLLDALRTKPFAILTGISGTGKTQIARGVAQYLTGDGSLDLAAGGGERYAFVSVRPDWTDSRKVFGYLNPATGRFHAHPVLRVLLAAYREGRLHGDAAPRHAVILDEMNLARVEYYLADLLSLMESPGEVSALHAEDRCVSLSGDSAGEGYCPVGADRAACAGCAYGPLRGVAPRADAPPVDPVLAERHVPPNVSFPHRNCVILGTVNVDETTSGFSPKVLDRAFVQEFVDADLPIYLEHALREPRSRLLVEKIGPALSLGGLRFGEEFLEALYEILRPHRLHFGYRVVSEMLGFLRSRLESGVTPGAADLDYLVLAKVLPKIRGRDEQLRGALGELLEFCRDERTIEPAWLSTLDRIDRFEDVPETWRFPTAAQKLFSMLVRGRESGFVSYF